jgi:hypothetical protein
MATLTGNKIKDTYSSLIKFSDNGIASGSLQLLSDGAGNSIGISVDTSGNISSAAVGTLIGTSSTDVIGASLLNVSGNGTSGQSLLSDGDGSFSWGSPSVTIADGSITTAKLAADAVDSDKIADGAIDTVHIADDQITYAKLGAEFTTAAALSGTEVDWATATTFTKTLGADTTLTFANVSTGMQINLVISGNYTLTLPTSVKELTNASTYDGSGENLISIVSTNGNTEQFATINKVA